MSADEHGVAHDRSCICWTERSCGCYLWDQDCPNYTPIRRTMNKMQQQVTDFHRAMELPVGHRARALPQERHAVRVELIREEFEELKDALAANDVVEQVDACLDLLYVVTGTLTEMGVNLEPGFDEVQRSNMSKFGEDGKPIIAGPNDPDGIFEGRVKKGPNYFKPDLRALLESGHMDLDIAGPRS